MYLVSYFPSPRLNSTPPEQNNSPFFARMLWYTDTFPAIERAPLNLPNSDANRQLESDTIATFNTALSNYASNFERTFHDSTVWIVDTHSAFLVALNDPIAYGAANASCYDADGVTCLWWNNYHPAEAIHRLVAEKVVSTLAGGSNFFGRKRCWLWFGGVYIMNMVMCSRLTSIHIV